MLQKGLIVLLVEYWVIYSKEHGTILIWYFFFLTFLAVLLMDPVLSNRSEFEVRI